MKLGLAGEGRGEESSSTMSRDPRDETGRRVDLLWGLLAAGEGGEGRGGKGGGRGTGGGVGGGLIDVVLLAAVTNCLTVV